MYVCVYVCIRTHTHTGMEGTQGPLPTEVQTRVPVRMYASYVCMYVSYVCMYVSHVCMYIRMYVYMHVCMYVRMYVRIYVCMHVCMNFCVYVCIHTYGHTHTDTDTHTHTHTSTNGRSDRIHHACTRRRRKILCGRIRPWHGTRRIARGGGDGSIGGGGGGSIATHGLPRCRRCPRLPWPGHGAGICCIHSGC
jgi:uncharacterized membrane protein YgcG